MRTLRLDIEYDGTRFAGWAAQPTQRTVEGALTATLSRLLSEDVRLSVAGRTDAGVHAAGQVASLRVESDMPVERIARALAGMLPDDVAVLRVEEAPPGFDARRDAVARRYEYRILTGRRSALRRARVLAYPWPLVLDPMRAAADAVVGQHDFTAFTPTRTEHVFFHRTVTICRWEVRDDELVLVVEADAFLRQMVRVLVGTMLLIGRESWTVDRMRSLLEGAPRSAAGPTAPAHALTLVGISYGEDPGGGG